VQGIRRVRSRVEVVLHWVRSILCYPTAKALYETNEADDSAVESHASRGHEGERNH